MPSENFIGENFDFTVTFDNTSGTDPGYGPFVDLIFPVNGADGAGGALNDYAANDSAAVTVNTVQFAKSVVTTSLADTGSGQYDPTVTDLAIGEQVTFWLTTTLPEGSMPITITDNLPLTPGKLSVVSSRVVAIGSNISGSNLAVGSAGTVSDSNSDGLDDQVECDFGTLTNAPDGVVDDNDRIIVEIVALVNDVADNSGGDSLTNNAQVDYGTGTTSASANVEIVEPQLAITKTWTPHSAAPNDTVVITLTVTNNGSATAYDVIVEDPLADNDFSGITEGSTPAGFTFSTQASSPNTIVRYTGGDIPAGESRVFTFQATLTDNVTAGETLTNTATVTQDTTLPGANSDERAEPNVSAQDTLTVVKPDLVLQKSDGDITAVPGQTIIYTLTLNNVGQHDADGVVITETVPIHTRFVAAASSSGWSCADGAPAGTICSMAVGALAANDGNTWQFAVAADDPLPEGVDNVTNNASAADDGTHGSDPTPANNSATEGTPVNNGQIGDTVWHGLNGDGVQGSGETGLAGVVLHLTEAGPDGTFGTGDDVAYPDQTTDSNGNYLFRDLPAGQYRVDVDESTLPADYVLTTGNEPLDKTLASAEHYFDADFGYVHPPIVAVDKSITAPSYTPVLVGDWITYTIRITNTGTLTITILPLLDSYDTSCLNYQPKSANPAEQTESGGDINWTDLVLSFGRHLGPGETFTITVPMQAIAASANCVNTATVHDYQGGSYPGQGTPNDSATTAIAEPASIGDRVWLDSNGDMAQDGSEIGINGATVRLYLDDGDGIFNGGDALTATTTASGDGDYDFTHLQAGSYWVEVVTTTLPSGLVSITDNSPLLVSVNPGDDYNDADFGYAQPVTIGDYVFVDSNANQVADPGETVGINNVTITLTDTVRSLVYTQTTANNGDYLFQNLPPGQYAIAVGPVSGMVRTTPSPQTFSISAGDNDLSRNFGFISPTGIYVTAFSAQAVADDAVLLRWATVDEDGIDAFAIWRQADSDWVQVGRVAAVGMGANNYQFRDEKVPAGHHSYRLVVEPGGVIVGPVSVDVPAHAAIQIFMPAVLH